MVMLSLEEYYFELRPFMPVSYSSGKEVDMIYVTGDTHGTVPFGYVSIDGISRRFNMAGFPE